MRNQPSCSFCLATDVLVQYPLASVIEDAHPASPGHLLLLPRRYEADFLRATPEERTAMLALADEARSWIEARHAPDGYNRSWPNGRPGQCKRGSWP